MLNLSRILALAAFLLVSARFASAANTFATFDTSVGTMELEFYDEDKPVTVSNFVKYVTSGRFARQFVQRWEPNFVIQGGGFYVTNTTTGPQFAVMPTFGQITNEYSVGRTLSNTYGTIAMARQGGNTNSATSQWFLNLTNNAFLDKVDGGFTVFGAVIAGTNVLNLFVPPPATSGIYLANAGGALSTLPTLKTNATYADLIYVQVRLRRDLGLAVNATSPAERNISWNTVAGVTNTLEYSNPPQFTNWTSHTSITGTGASHSVVDSSGEAGRIYRVKLFY